MEDLGVTALPDEAQWAEIQAAMERLIDVAPGDRPRAIERLAGGNLALRARLAALCAGLDDDDPLLDRPAAALLGDPQGGGPDALPARSMIGPWRVVGL